MTDKRINPSLKLALDLGPLVLFFVANARFGIFTATATFMVAVVVALVVSYVLVRRLPVMLLLTAAIVLVFGGLTLALHDDTFIKLKPTLIYLLFAGMLTAGLLLGRPLLAVVLDSVFELTEEGWHRLTVRWIAFFVVMAVVNELVWRTQSTDFWVNFKLFGFVPLTFVFAALQYPLMMRHTVANVQPKAAADEPTPGVPPPPR